MTKLLIIEDEQILREAYKLILSKEGYEVYEAADGDEGLTQLADVRPDIVLLDIIMPKMDGIEFVKQARLKKDHPQAKVVIFSNLSDHNRLQKIRKFGVKHNVLKSSLSPKDLVQVVKEVAAEKA